MPSQFKKAEWGQKDDFFDEQVDTNNYHCIVGTWQEITECDIKARIKPRVKPQQRSELLAAARSRLGAWVMGAGSVTGADAATSGHRQVASY